MTKRILITLLLIAFAFPAMAESKISSLTGKTLIDGDAVTVGDLFTNAGINAGHVLAPAPEIGKTLTLTRSDLQRVAIAFKLNWNDADKAAAYVTLERNASLVSVEEIVEALAQSDLKDKIHEGSEFKISNLQDPVLVSGKDDLKLAISDTTFDGDTEKFAATLQISQDDKVVKLVRLEGLATMMVRVPVAKFQMSGSNVISENDLTEIKMPKQQLRGDIFLQKKDLIGMTAKRSLQANQVISKSDVIPPVLVKRNDMVTITYRNGPILLSAKARSLGAGSYGDNVMFMNMKSKKPFEAKVTGAQAAEVNLEG